MKGLLLVLCVVAAACNSGTSAVHGTRAGSTTTSLPTGVSTTPTTTTTPMTPTTATRPPTTTRTTGTAAAGSGVRGTVSAGPTCPVERVGDPCPPRPVQTGLQLRTGGGVVVATGASGGDGRFSIAAPAGSYTLETTPGSSPFPRCPTVQVTVSAGSYTPVDMTCDTGIR
jgi:hypothetical protein